MKGLLRWGLGVGLVVGLLTNGAFAQQQVLTVPLPALSGDASGTIASTGTFQLVWAGTGTSAAPAPATSPTRHGCSIQNNGANVMYVSEGQGLGASTTGAAWQVVAGALFNCNFAGIVLTGEIDITGTSGDAFVAKQF